MLLKTLLGVSFQVENRGFNFIPDLNLPENSEKAESFAYKLGYFVGANFWPILIALLTILAIIIAVFYVRKKKEKDTEGNENEN